MTSDIYLKYNAGLNCLHHAALNGHLDLCKTLVDKHNFDEHMTDKAGWTVLHPSAGSGNYELVKYFADRNTNIYLKTNAGWNCLHIAARRGHFDLCKTLVEKYNFEVHVVDNLERTAIFHSTTSGNYELVRYFADRGTNIHLKANGGWNCLHNAAFHGHLHLFKTLIDKHHFDAQMCIDNGMTVIHCAARSGSYELLRYFSDFKTYIGAKDSFGWNCLHNATYNRNFNLCKKLVNKHKFDVHVTANTGTKVLHFSAASGSYELFTYFVGMGVDIDLTCNSGLSSLHIAEQYGHLSLCNKLIDKHNFDVHIANNHRWTALHFSAIYGSYELVRYFVYMGSDIHPKTNNEKNCLHIAAHYGHFNLCKSFLENHNFDVCLTGSEG